MLCAISQKDLGTFTQQTAIADVLMCSARSHELLCQPHSFPGCGHSFCRRASPGLSVYSTRWYEGLLRTGSAWSQLVEASHKAAFGSSGRLLHLLFFAS